MPGQVRGERAEEIRERGERRAARGGIDIGPPALGQRRRQERSQIDALQAHRLHRSEIGRIGHCSVVQGSLSTDWKRIECENYTRTIGNSLIAVVSCQWNDETHSPGHHEVCYPVQASLWPTRLHAIGGFL